MNKGMNFRKKENLITYFGVILLIILDQIVKLIINNYKHIEVEIIPGIISFSPILNDKYSYINSLFDLGWGRFFHIILNLIILIIIYQCFKCYYSRGKKSIIIKMCEVFFLSGT
ncbi:signal peptidase II, partial [Clostridium sp.]|uniref:signal peptidase II n=1 Tax=Clostridium sp. TaxID=1506 RepID=UPI0034640340